TSTPWRSATATCSWSCAMRRTASARPTRNEPEGSVPMKEAKTNAMRALERAKIAYIPHEYDASEGVDGVHAAQSLGVDPARVFKTLVTHARSGGHCVFVIPVARELDLKKAARAAGEKS